MATRARPRKLPSAWAQARARKLPSAWGMSVDYAQKHRRHLIDAGAIQSAGRRKVAFAVPYLKEFLREELGE